MKRIILLLALLLGLASLASAGEIVIPISTQDMDTFTYQERDLDSFMLDISSELAGRRLLSARLEMRVAAAAGATAGRTEIQIAEWDSGAPVVPEGKFRPQSLSVMGTGCRIVHMDITAILAPIFSAGVGDEVRLVLGRILDWDGDMNGAALAPLDAGAGVQFKLYLQVM